MLNRIWASPLSWKIGSSIREHLFGSGPECPSEAAAALIPESKQPVGAGIAGQLAGC